MSAGELRVCVSVWVSVKCVCTHMCNTPYAVPGTQEEVRNEPRHRLGTGEQSCMHGEGKHGLKTEK